MFTGFTVEGLGGPGGCRVSLMILGSSKPGAVISTWSTYDQHALHDFG